MDRFNLVNNAIEREMKKPYKFGKSDCFFLALAVIDAVTKSKLRKEYSNIYKTFQGAQDAMKERGFKSMGDIFDNHLERIPASRAGMGDIAVLDLDGKEHSAVCVFNAFVTRTETGRRFHALTDVKSAFRVA